MRYIYSFFNSAYQSLVGIAAIRKTKAKQFIQGRKDIFERLEKDLKNSENLVWVHCASLGEFEQGRPLIEKIKKEYPDKKIILTFFSPSGYEIRKNYELADYIYYLPVDTIGNAKRFIDIVKPEVAYFVKYEMWYNYYTELGQRGIPLYLVSAIFRPNQFFFKPYGRWFLKALRSVEHFFVQNEKSYDLLKSHGFANVEITGDTRFDRVVEIVNQSKELPMVEQFANGHRIIVCGSTWEPDEELLLQLLNNDPTLKLIIAPHEIGGSRIDKLQASIKVKSQRYSSLSTIADLDTRVLIIDGYGLLSSIYRYGQMAYIGGGFGVGIHNTLEAAAYGMPVIFGPNYLKFQEACDMIELEAAFSISDENELQNVVTKLYGSEEKFNATVGATKAYVQQNCGASEKILKYTMKSN